MVEKDQEYAFNLLTPTRPDSDVSHAGIFAPLTRFHSVCHLLMELTLGTVSPSHTPSARSLSLISQANMVGFCLL